MQFTQEQLSIRSLARELAGDGLAATAKAMDERDAFPQDAYRGLVNAGFVGLTGPEDVGGSGADTVSWAIAIEQFARACPQMGAMILLSKQAVDLLLIEGRAPHRARARDIVSGDLICAVAAAEVSAERVANGYRLHGGAHFVTGGCLADHVLALVPDERHDSDGPAVFSVDARAAGVSVRNAARLMGMRGLATADVGFDAVFVSADDFLGGTAQAAARIRQVLDLGRIGSGALSVGIAEGALEASVSYAKVRVQFGQAIVNFEGIQHLLADMDLRTEAARLLVVNAAQKHVLREPFQVEAARAALAAADAAVAVTSDAVQIHGGYGYAKETQVERMYRDAKVNQVRNGTGAVLRAAIARHILA